MKNKKYARFCEITGEGMNEGYECGDYFWTSWECWDCEAENTHNIDEFGFCKECLQSQ